MGVGPGDEVITVSHSFIATANGVRYCGAAPVFVDIDPRHLQHGPGADRGGHHARTRAILCVHQMGMPCDLGDLGDRRRHGLPVVEDAACAIGSEILVERPAGSGSAPARRHRLLLVPPAQGDHHRRRRHAHHGRPELDAAFRLLRQHGMSVPDTVRHGRAR